MNTLCYAFSPRPWWILYTATWRAKEPRYIPKRYGILFELESVHNKEILYLFCNITFSGNLAIAFIDIIIHFLIGHCGLFLHHIAFVVMYHNLSLLQNAVFCVTSQKTAFFIVTAMKTSNLIFLFLVFVSYCFPLFLHNSTHAAGTFI
jgi:hypothetical protein